MPLMPYSPSISQRLQTLIHRSKRKSTHPHATHNHANQCVRTACVLTKWRSYIQRGLHIQLMLIIRMCIHVRVVNFIVGMPGVDRRSQHATASTLIPR